MSNLDELIYRALKKKLQRPPTRQEVAKFERKKQLLERIHNDDEVIKFRVEVKGYADMKAGEPWGQMEFEQEGIADLDRVKIRYMRTWY